MAKSEIRGNRSYNGKGVSTIDEGSRADSHWKVMVFMDEYEMPSIFLHIERRDGNSPHSRPRIRGERKKSISTFCFRRCVIIRGWFAICRVTFGPRRPRYITQRVYRFDPRVFPRLYGLTPRFYTINRVLERGIIATLVISNLSSFRTCYSLILRGGTRVLFHEKFQRVRIANRVYKISLSRNSC